MLSTGGSTDARCVFIQSYRSNTKTPVKQLTLSGVLLYCCGLYESKRSFVWGQNQPKDFGTTRNARAIHECHDRKLHMRDFTLGACIGREECRTGTDMHL